MGEVAWLMGGRKRLHWRMGEVAALRGGEEDLTEESLRTEDGRASEVV